MDSQEKKGLALFSKRIEKRTLVGVILGLGFSLFLLIYFLPQLIILIESFKKPNFDHCEILAESCLDKDCPYYFLCDGAKFSCNVYDCDSYYGVIFEDKDGKIIAKEQPKPQQQKVKEAINKCRGTVEVLEKKQDGKNLKIKVEVITQGQCQIQVFMVKTQDGWQTPVFKKENDYYNLTLNVLPEEVLEIIAVGQGGVSIKEKKN